MCVDVHGDNALVLVREGGRVGVCEGVCALGCV